MFSTQKLNKEFPEKLYEMLDIPGTYDIAQIAEAAGFALIFPIESMKSALKIVAKGDWLVQANFFSENQKIAAFKVPSNTDWIYVN
ncbi:hypothetical protein OESDEN_24741 [Oesophagostomum dentatum]|uniref:Uncharacterized protein n=1 Tax=Oesophagostomum dentatum TaxID=61180 RepID=A0A0B1RRI5_OESDE|nr:hypothetical protein OESDEN_24741 [Oesophagostomum dentatum]